MNLVDSSGWLEFFAEGSNADFFEKAIQDTENLLVSTINLFEVFKRILSQKGEMVALQAVAQMQLGQVVDVDAEIALNAAKLSTDLKLPLADSIILQTARKYQATLWTQDADFEGMEGVQFIVKK